MAGSAMGDGEEAVSLNVTPHIDIIVCLCVFFMCSFHFRQLEGKLDSWLPHGPGCQTVPIHDARVEEIRVLFTREPSGGTKVVFGSRVVGVLPVSLGESLERERVLRDAEALVVAQHEDYLNAGGTSVPVILDSEPGVPWRDVLAMLDLCKKRAIDKVEFTQPWPGGVRR
ncbi:biopolymer transporter ExbD [bacterium]|nr:biopolymer transporter ExbD [bacterium]